MQKIFYRQLGPTDYTEYRRTRLACLHLFPGYFGSTCEEEFKAGSLKLDKAIKASDKSNFAMGAFTSGADLIGICGFVTDMRLKTRHRGEIVHVFVDPRFEGNGIGRKLLQLTINKAFQNTEIEQIILGVVFTNEKAVTLYKQLGFVEYGRLENYFKMGSQHITQLFLRLAKSGTIQS